MYKICHHIAGMILIYLQTTASEEEIQIQQNPTQLCLHTGETAQLHCKISQKEVSAMWYKEQQSGSLLWISQSSEFGPSDGKYSIKVNIVSNTFSLVISNVQRNDSGVYFCGPFASFYLQPNFGNGTRLIVTDASEPRLSILAPSFPDDAELPPIIPLLCLLSDFTPPWRAVLWDTGEAESEGQMGAGAIDEKGVVCVWSLMTIPSEMWNKEKTYTCTAKDSRTGKHISATVSKETERRDAGDCRIVLYAGLLCIFILLLVQLLCLVYKKSPSETKYATVMFNNRMSLCN